MCLSDCNGDMCWMDHCIICFADGHIRLHLCTAAAAAFSTLPSHAFVVGPRTLAPRCISVDGPSSLAYHHPHSHATLTTRRFFSGRNDNSNKDEGGVLGGLKKAAKSILPASWFQSEKEKKAAIERPRVKDEVSGGIKEMLKDAPLPIRMMGSMMGPLVS